MAGERGLGQAFAAKVRAFFQAHRSLETVAGDAQLTAELLLLVRMSFVDRKVDAGEATAFKAICTRALGLKEQELHDILEYLHDFGYETDDRQAAAMLADLSDERKREILAHMKAIAASDGKVDPREQALLNSTAARLGLG